MIEQITEHVEYEKGYLKGFHDGRKWKQEETHEDEVTLKVMERWNKYVDKHVDDKAPLDEQYEQIQAAWSIYNGLPFTDKEWRKLINANLHDLAEQIIHRKASFTEAIASLSALSNWISTIQKEKTPKT